MIGFMQIILHFGFLKLQNIGLALTNFQFLILVLSTVSIAGAGYLINDILDQDTDAINKPNRIIIGNSISEKKAYNFYILLNCIGVGAGFYLSNVIEKSSFAAVFVIIAITLYLYATNLKQSLLIGNILISILIALSVLIVGIFDLYPIITYENQAFLAVVFKIIVDYSIFAFIINFLREIVKDLEDIEGDSKLGMNTLPIALGVSRATKFVFGLSFIPILVLIFYVNHYYFQNKLYYSTLYSIIFLIAPTIFFTIKMWNAKAKKDFHNLSSILKIILFFGILSILVVSLEIKYNA